MKTADIKIKYIPSIDDSYRAIAINMRTNKEFLIADYSSIEAAVKLAPVKLKSKIDNPSSNFRRAMME